MAANKITENLDMKMKKYLIYILPLIFLAALLQGCADLQSDISKPVEVNFHGPGSLNPSAPDFHGNMVRNAKWDMKVCESCHGADLTGNTAEGNCMNCHTEEDGPKACNTCHGTFADPSRIAPPRDISENISSALKGVGAHVQHIYERDLGARVRCSTCHIIPQDVYQPGHMVNDDLPAEVMLKGDAFLFGADNAAYDYNSTSCANSYCHGNFTFYRDSADVTNRFAYTADRMTGLNKTVTWTNVNQGEAVCGSCHGLPPEGHIVNAEITINTCYQCHGDVIDENGFIIDKEKHINGEKDARLD